MTLKLLTIPGGIRKGIECSKSWLPLLKSRVVARMLWGDMVERNLWFFVPNLSKKI